MSLPQRFPPPPQAPQATPAAVASTKGCGCVATLFVVFAALLVLAALVTANCLPAAIVSTRDQMQSASATIRVYSFWAGAAGFLFLVVTAGLVWTWLFDWFRLAVAAPATLRELLAAQHETNRLLGELLTTVKAGETSEATSGAGKGQGPGPGKG